MNDAALQMVVYRAVIVSKLQYASCAWWGFLTAADRQRIKFDAVLDVDSIWLNYHRLEKFANQLMEHCFAVSLTIRVVYCFTYFRHNLSHRNTIFFGVVVITCKYRRELTISMTSTSSLECYMQIPINLVSNFPIHVNLCQLSK